MNVVLLVVAIGEFGVACVFARRSGSARAEVRAARAARAAAEERHDKQLKLAGDAYSTMEKGLHELLQEGAKELDRLAEEARQHKAQYAQLHREFSASKSRVSTLESQVEELNRLGRERSEGRGELETLLARERGNADRLAKAVETIAPKMRLKDVPVKAVQSALADHRKLRAVVVTGRKR